MNRRRVLSLLAALGLTSGSLWVARTGLSSGQVSSLPVRVETLDARGSEAGRTYVPVPETPTVIDLFATWCAPCKAQMDELGAVHPEYTDHVAFVSVTNERIGETLSRADIREWWQTHEGNWTIGLDPESELLAALGADGLPYLAITDHTGTVRWRHAGVADASTLRERLERVLSRT